MVPGCVAEVQQPSSFGDFCFRFSDLGDAVTFCSFCVHFSFATHGGIRCDLWMSWLRKTGLHVAACA
jgi:hypothetical protein